MKIGTFVFLPSPEATEAIALAGVERIIVDREHASTGWHEVRAMTVAAQGVGAEVFVRVRDLTNSEVLPALELGVDGIVLPFVSDEADVRRLVELSRYPPEGKRGTCTLTRAAQYGLQRGNFSAHSERENRRVQLIGLLETDLSDVAINAIAGVDNGLDGVLIGRSDLAASLGHPGAVDDERVLEVSRRMISACRRGAIGDIGIVIYNPEELGEWERLGITTAFYSADVAVLAKSYRDFVVQVQE